MTSRKRRSVINIYRIVDLGQWIRKHPMEKIETPLKAKLPPKPYLKTNVERWRPITEEVG
jgi:hypothetical protein